MIAVIRPMYYYTLDGHCAWCVLTICYAFPILPPLFMGHTQSVLKRSNNKFLMNWELVVLLLVK